MARSYPILGHALVALAKARVPVFRAEHFAGRSPDADAPDTSPIIDDVWTPPPAKPGVLDGDVVVKDQVDVAGLPTRVGLGETQPPADKDATLVARIIAAGGRIIGKAKMTELGIDGLGTLMPYPMPGNPVAPGYVPGGSSTGTAVAVARGLARYGVGGDGLGSVRIPAAFNGLYGLKPSRTRIPRDGIRSPVRSLDAVGPICRTAADTAALWQVMVGEPVTALTPLVPPRVGVPIIGGPLRVARPIWLAFQRMLAALQIDPERVVLPGLENVTFLGGMTGSYELTTGPYSGRTQTAAGRRSLRLGGMISELTFKRLQDHRERLKDSTARLLAHTPFLALPTTAIPPPALEKSMLAGNSEVVMLRALGAFTPLANLCDLPAIAAPMGVDERGRPLSIMFVGGPMAETDLLRIALAVEQTGLARTPI